MAVFSDDLSRRITEMVAGNKSFAKDLDIAVTSEVKKYGSYFNIRECRGFRERGLFWEVST